jgi:hypothetical protein
LYRGFRRKNLYPAIYVGEGLSAAGDGRRKGTLFLFRGLLGFDDTNVVGPTEGRDAIILEKKEDMKKRGLASPDLADALALCTDSHLRLRDASVAYTTEGCAPPIRKYIRIVLLSALEGDDGHAI